MEIFQYRDYRDFLQSYLKSLPRGGRGIKTQLSQVLRCHPTQISHAFAKKINLTIEQSLELCQHFDFGVEETRFFLLLVHLQRAENFKLKQFYEGEVDRELKKRELISKTSKEREKISEHERRIYYSSWYYSAIHVLLSIPEFQDPTLLENYLPISKEIFYEALGFLLETGLAQRKKNKIVIGKKKVEFTRGTEEHRSFLRNWRVQANYSIDRNHAEDTHSTFVLSLSKRGRDEVVAKWKAFIGEVSVLVAESPEEKAFCLSFDFFGL